MAAPLEKRMVPCAVCGGTAHELLYPDELGDRIPPVDYNFSRETRATFAIVRCTTCGMIFTNPMPRLEQAYHDTVDQQYLQSVPQRVRTAERAVERLLRYAPAGGRLLDIGCSTGVFLDAASKHFRVEGIELSHWAREIARQKHTVHDTPLPALDLPGTFDVITLFGVIEHLEDPDADLAAISRALKPGGILAIYTGDVDAWLPRVLGKRWWWYQGMHVQYFSRRTCARLLDKHGIDVAGVENYSVYFQMFSLGVSLQRYPLGGLVSRMLAASPWRNSMVELRLSGEMMMYGRRR